MSTKKISKQQKTKLKLHNKVAAWALGIIGGIFILLILLYIINQVSPWPGALLVRYEFEKGGKKTAMALEKYVPSGVTGIYNQQYRDNDKDAKLDVYYPTGTTKPLPTIVWVHGGAWVSGSKENVANYLKILASHGYTVVGIDYSIAPEKKYPTPVVQTNAALEYLQKNAERLYVDKDKITLAGDSAGSQIAAQVATIITNDKYAQQVGIQPSISSSQLKTVVLNCGAYDLALPNYNGTDGKFLETVLWAYSGTKDFLGDKRIAEASVVDYVNKDFPATFITAGNADPLEGQSKEFAQKLTSLGVPTDSLFYAPNHQPALPHEYQFNLDQSDGRNALQRILDFLGKNAQ